MANICCWPRPSRQRGGAGILCWAFTWCFSWSSSWQRKRAGGAGQNDFPSMQLKLRFIHDSYMMKLIWSLKQGEQGNINIIVAWAEGALVQVPWSRFAKCNFVFHLLPSLLSPGGQDDQCFLPCWNQGGNCRTASCSGGIFFTNILFPLCQTDIMASCSDWYFSLSQVSLYQKQVSLEGLSAQVLNITFFVAIELHYTRKELFKLS